MDAAVYVSHYFAIWTQKHRAPRRLAAATIKDNIYMLEERRNKYCYRVVFTMLLVCVDRYVNMIPTWKSEYCIWKVATKNYYP